MLKALVYYVVDGTPWLLTRTMGSGLAITRRDRRQAIVYRVF